MMSDPRSGGDDQDLFARMAGGDESALATAYDAWGSRVYSVAFWILQDADDAEDVVEETFWEAWRYAAKFDARRGGGQAWVTLKARCRALDRLRQQRRREARLANRTSDTLLPDAPDAALGTPSLEGGEPSDRVARALGDLAPEQRRVIELAFFSGLSHSEIATQLTIPLGTVKTRIRLAMQKLRLRLVRHDEEPK